MTETPLALGGLKVVEFGDFISSAYAGKLLADLGADVIKVEPPAGDSARSHGPFPNDEAHAEKSGLYLFLNSNKRGVTLDLEHEDGRALLRELTGWADLVVHNQRPGDLRRWGLDYDSLAAEQPELVMSSISVFGHGTPHQDWAGTALTAMAASGLARYIGDPDRSPLWLPYSAADIQGGIHGAIAAMLALRARKSTGEGQHAWVSIVEVMGTTLRGDSLPQYIYAGQLRGRDGAHNHAFYPWQVTPAKDGYIEVITMVDDQWSRFMELMGNPPWKDDERLENRWFSSEWADELDAFWHPWLAERGKAELSELFKANHIPFQPVHDVSEVAKSEHLAGRDFFQEVEHPQIGSYRTLGAPYRLSLTPWSIRKPPPLLGQHNEEILGEMLGHEAAELASLAQMGAL